MGWTGLNLWFDKELEKFGAPLKLNVRAFLDDLVTENGERFVYKPLKSIMHGSTYYCAIERTDKEAKKVIVYGLVILTQKQGHEFYYKELTEFEEPFYYDCPKSILKLLSPTDNNFALMWRKKCEEKLEKKKKIRTFWKVAQDKTKVTHMKYTMPFSLDPDRYGYKIGDVAYLTYGNYCIHGKVRKCWSDGIYYFSKPKIDPKFCVLVAPDETEFTIKVD